MRILDTFNFLFLFRNGLGMDVGIFSVQCSKDFRDGLCEYTGVWVHHACQVLVFHGFVDLAFESCLDQVDVCECSAFGVERFFRGGYLDSGHAGIGWCCWCSRSGIRKVRSGDGHCGCIVDESEVAHLAIAEVARYGTGVRCGFFLDLSDCVIRRGSHDFRKFGIGEEAAGERKGRVDVVGHGVFVCW